VERRTKRSDQCLHGHGGHLQKEIVVSFGVLHLQWYGAQHATIFEASGILGNSVCRELLVYPTKDYFLPRYRIDQ